jgi:glutamate dehydrogenase/leucine dehydrogenase
MESLLKAWDGETLITRFDRPSGAWIFMAIHSTRLGPPVSGGTRLKAYPTVEAGLQDALNLSAAMTLKLALAGIAPGGGKVVIALPPNFDLAARPGLLRRYGALLRQLGGLFLTGPDAGTSPADMDIILPPWAGRKPARCAVTMKPTPSPRQKLSLFRCVPCKFWPTRWACATRLTRWPGRTISSG